MSKYIVCYDIKDLKRLNRVRRIMLKYAFPLEYSVFYFDGTEKDFEYCINSIKETINLNQDDVRCYGISDNTWKRSLGCSVLPEGIVCSSLPASDNHLFVIE